MKIRIAIFSAIIGMTFSLGCATAQNPATTGSTAEFQEARASLVATENAQATSPGIRETHPGVQTNQPGIRETYPTNQPGIRETHPTNQPGIRVAGTKGGVWNPNDPRQEQPGEAVRARTAVGGNLPGVNAIEIRPTNQNALQVWYPCKGCQEKITLIFRSQAAMEAWRASQNPSIETLIANAYALPIGESSVGYGQQWLSF